MRSPTATWAFFPPPRRPPPGQAASNIGIVNSFNVASSGTLTPSVGSPYQAGTTPSAIASDPTSRFVYITDSNQNQLITYTVLSTNQLVASPNPPVKTDTFPVAITVDPRGTYIY